MTQLHLFADPCKRCGELFDPKASDFYCDACSQHLEKTFTVFKRPLTPQTLWNRVGYNCERLDDDELVTVYKYTMFAQALQRFWTYQHYRWPQNLRCALSQWAGYDNVQRIEALLSARGLACDANNYHIDFQAMQAWIDAQKSE